MFEFKQSQLQSLCDLYLWGVEPKDADNNYEILIDQQIILSDIQRFVFTQQSHCEVESWKFARKIVLCKNPLHTLTEIPSNVLLFSCAHSAFSYSILSFGRFVCCLFSLVVPYWYKHNLLTHKKWVHSRCVWPPLSLFTTLPLLPLLLLSMCYCRCWRWAAVAVAAVVTIGMYARTVYACAHTCICMRLAAQHNKTNALPLRTLTHSLVRSHSKLCAHPLAPTHTHTHSPFVRFEIQCKRKTSFSR